MKVYNEKTIKGMKVKELVELVLEKSEGLKKLVQPEDTEEKKYKKAKGYVIKATIILGLKKKKVEDVTINSIVALIDGYWRKQQNATHD